PRCVSTNSCAPRRPRPPPSGASPMTSAPPAGCSVPCPWTIRPGGGIVTPDEVLEALKAHEFDRVHSVASPEFRDAISDCEMRQVWTEMEASIGTVQRVGQSVVLHDLALHCEGGDAHLQVAYRDGTLSGLVLLGGEPTGRFGD